MLKPFLALTALVILATGNALAEDCSSLAEAQASITKGGGGKLAMLTRDELMFARGMYASAPPMSRYPRGEDGMIATRADGASVVLFVEDAQVCGKILVSPEMTKLLLAVDKSI